MEETSRPPEHGGRGWSIIDGFYNPNELVIDDRRLRAHDMIAESLPDIARERYLVTETVFYAYELANPFFELSEPTVKREARESMLELAAKTALESPTVVRLTAEKIRTTTLTGLPMVQVLKKILDEHFGQNELFQDQCLSIVVKLARQDPTIKFFDVRS